MAIRTIQIFGKAFGETPAMVVATLDGTQVFNATVTTVNEPVWSIPNSALVPEQDLLFAFDVDTTTAGSFPMSYTVSNGTVIFGSIKTNYVEINNPVYTPEQIAELNNPNTTRAQRNAIYQTVANPPLSQQDLDTLSDPAVPQSVKNAIVLEHNCAPRISSGPSGFEPIVTYDPRTNPAIDGVAQNPQRDLGGIWWWTISDGSTLSYDLEIQG